MHIPKLALLGSVVLGLIATFAVATTSQANRNAPTTPAVESTISASVDVFAGGADAETIVTQVLARTTEKVSIRYTTHGADAATFAFEPPAPAPIECGGSLPVAGPAGGMAGTGNGPNANAALAAAFADLMSKLFAYSKAKCQTCPIVDRCQLSGSFLTEGFTLVALFPVGGGAWTAVINYTGPYFMLCSDCVPPDGE